MKPLSDSSSKAMGPRKKDAGGANLKAMGPATKTSMGSTPTAMGSMKKTDMAPAQKAMGSVKVPHMGSSKAAMGSSKGMGSSKATKSRATATSYGKTAVATKGRPVPKNPIHGHHPEASHEWHTIPGAKTMYKVLKPGNPSGAYIKGGDTVTMHATGRVKDSGKKFWSTHDSGHKPFTYKQGAGVIRAWDAGTRGMRVGERRQLSIPAAEAYGADGFTHWDIPPKKDLEFELEVVKIKSKHHQMEL